MYTKYIKNNTKQILQNQYKKKQKKPLSITNSQRQISFNFQNDLVLTELI